MKRILQAISDSTPVQVLIAVLFYGLYASVIGVCLVPSIYLVLWAIGALLPDPSFGNIVLFGLCLGAALFLYFITGVIVMGGLIRLISLGMKPGRYPVLSLTMLRWLLYSGIATIATVTVLPMIPVSWFSNLYFKIVGCKMGKNVYLNSFLINDAYLVEIGDDVTVGGKANISCHLFEKGWLILDRIKIGSHSLIGSFAYIAPGVTVGEHCTVGLNCYVRRGARIPDGSVYTSLGGLPIRKMAHLEKMASAEQRN
jgi:acetyltransferase-like isoleucine patch superfamily enzyme